MIYELQVCDSQFRDEPNKGLIGTIQIELCQAAQAIVAAGMRPPFNTEARGITALVEGRHSGLTVLLARPRPDSFPAPMPVPAAIPPAASGVDSPADQREHRLIADVWALAMLMPSVLDDPSPRGVTAGDAVEECRLRIKAMLLTVEGVVRENAAMRKLLDDRKRRGR